MTAELLYRVGFHASLHSHNMEILQMIHVHVQLATMVHPACALLLDLIMTDASRPHSTKLMSLASQ